MPNEWLAFFQQQEQFPFTPATRLHLTRFLADTLISVQVKSALLNSSFTVQRQVKPRGGSIQGRRTQSYHPA